MPIVILVVEPVIDRSKEKIPVRLAADLRQEDGDTLDQTVGMAKASERERYDRHVGPLRPGG
ncbi:MAG: hypothetical protein U5K29_02140 [Acidimicrobiales bacterium]|nr:hypothetical protein [Acidimicrobiales bacterium]